MYKLNGSDYLKVRCLSVFMWVLFSLYLIVLAKMILFKFPMDSVFRNMVHNWSEFGRALSYIQIIPFKTVTEYLVNSNNLPLRIILENLLGNIIGFMPFGFFLPLISQKTTKLSRVTLWTLGVSFSFEAFQLIFRLGSFDIDDMILNAFGGVLGFIALKILKLIPSSFTLRSKKLAQ